MLHWPNLLLHFSEATVSFIKNPILVFSIVVLYKYGYKYIINYSYIILLLSFIAINYCYINGYWFHSYLFKVIYFALFCGTIYSNPKLIDKYFNILIIISTILGVQAFVYTLFWILKIEPQFIKHYFIDGGEVYFNFLFGVKADFNYFRINSFFTESNRFFYFLTPGLFIAHYNWRYVDKRFKYPFVIILVASVFTFSLFGLLSSTIGVLMIIFRKLSLKSVLALGFLSGFIYLLIFSYHEFFTFMFDKTGSISDRTLGMESKLRLLAINPFGWPERRLVSISEAIAYGNSTLTLLNWAIIGGVQSVIVFFLTIGVWLISAAKLYRRIDIYYRYLGVVFFVVILQQSFYGTYFEYNFLSLMAILVTLNKTSPSKTVIIQKNF